MSDLVSTTMDCPVCRWPKAECSEDFDTDEYRVNCRRCGDYAISKEAASDFASIPYPTPLENSEDEEAGWGHDSLLLVGLSAHTRQKTEQKRNPIHVESTHWRLLAKEHMVTTAEAKERKLLGWIRANSSGPGQTFRVHPLLDYVIADARHPREVSFFLANLERQGVVELDVRNVDTICYNSIGVKMSMEGWLRGAGMISNNRETLMADHRVFIGHGASPIWRELKDFLLDSLNLDYEEFNRNPVAGLATKERLEQMLRESTFAFLIFTAEDEHSDGSRHPRLNVVHEAGLFQGKLGFNKAILLVEEGCESFSNIHGLTVIPFRKDEISAKFEEIRRVLDREGIRSAQPKRA